MNHLMAEKQLEKEELLMEKNKQLVIFLAHLDDVEISCLSFLLTNE